jgi:hypothetical protein
MSYMQHLLKKLLETSTEKQIKLFHATNLKSALSMKKHGMGFDKSDYANLADELAKELKIAKPIRDKIFDKVYDTTSGESQGQVSFFPKKQSCEKIAKIYAKGGEWKSSFCRNFLKNYARLSKQPWKKFEPIISKIIGEPVPVIVEVSLPVSFIANKISSNNEMYTKGKVPAKYIIRIHKIT